MSNNEGESMDTSESPGGNVPGISPPNGNTIETAPPGGSTTEHSVMVWVGWPKDELQNQKRELEKALQSWLNKSNKLPTTSCSVINITHDGMAEITMSPSPAIKKLHNLGEILLTFRDQQTVPIRFGLTPNEHDTETGGLSVHGPSSLPSAQQNAETQEKAKPTSAAAGGQDTCNIASLPLALFWYMNLAYKKEIKRIEEDNGVQIDFKVFFNPAQSAADPHNALEEFTQLAQRCNSDYCNFTRPLKDVDVSSVEDTLRMFQRGDTKLVLSVSSEEVTVLGPSSSLDPVRKNMKILHNASQGALQISANIKDPLVDGGVAIDEIMWKVLTLAFKEKMADIKAKFGVCFQTSGITQGKVTVRAKAKADGTVEACFMKSHALSALVRLYQKVATSTISCVTKVLPDVVEEGGNKLRDICSRHNVIVTGGENAPFTLIGLPENLGPAVYMLQKIIGGPVVGEADMERIGYLRYAGAAGATADKEEGATAGGATGESDDEKCPICLDTFVKKTRLKCSHAFCKECLSNLLKNMGPVCPMCKAVFGKVEGNQPHGKMSTSNSSVSLPGFSGYGMIIINYSFQSGRQTEKHPNPGKFYHGTSRMAYLPDNKEGREVLSLLKKAFDQKLVFTVGTSRTTGAEDQVTWNDIHHKTNTNGGPQSFGYPDPDYMKRVREELKAKGIE